MPSDLANVVAPSLPELHQLSRSLGFSLSQTMNMTVIPGTCRFCGCTEEQACEGGCSWADFERTICSNCIGAIDIEVFTFFPSP